MATLQRGEQYSCEKLRLRYLTANSLSSGNLHGTQMALEKRIPRLVVHRLRIVPHISLRNGRTKPVRVYVNNVIRRQRARDIRMLIPSLQPRHIFHQSTRQFQSLLVKILFDLGKPSMDDRSGEYDGCSVDSKSAQLLQFCV